MNNDTVAQELVGLSRSYFGLIPLIKKMQSNNYSISEAIADLKSLDFKNDPANIQQYILRRLQTNDLKKIIKIEKKDISPSVYSQLTQCQPTTTAIERSFSQLGKVLIKGRNFLPENVSKYMVFYFNHSFPCLLYTSPSPRD